MCAPRLLLHSERSVTAAHLAPIKHTEKRNCSVTKTALSSGDSRQSQSKGKQFLHQAKRSKHSLTEVNRTETQSQSILQYTLKPSYYSYKQLVKPSATIKEKRRPVNSHFVILIQFCVKISHLWQRVCIMCTVNILHTSYILARPIFDNNVDLEEQHNILF